MTRFKRVTRILLSLSVVLLISAGCNQQSALTTNNQQLPTNAELSIQIRQKVEGDMGDNLFNIYPSEQKTALDLLKMGHQVETKTFKDAGEYVTAINGQKEEKGKKFWAFYLNGVQSALGAASYKPVNKDYIEWKLEIIK